MQKYIALKSNFQHIHLFTIGNICMKTRKTASKIKKPFNMSNF